MARGVPVLGQDNDPEVIHQRVDPRNDFISTCNGERTSGAKIVLNIDDDESVGFGVHVSLRFGVALP